MTVLLWLSLLAAPASARGPVLAVGGGERPPAAMERFVGWAGGRSARILVVTWASEIPEETYAALKEDLAPFGPAAIEHAASTAAAARVLEQLGKATGVFLSGGDQVRLMTAMESGGLAEAFRESSRRGTPFAGTSAGTAALSRVMITGDGDFSVLDGERVGTREGLGLLEGVITDQHFIARRRHNRLFGLALKHRDLLGLGVDEDTGVAIEKGRYAEVLGSRGALTVAADGDRRLIVDVLRPGDRYDLKRRRRLR